MAAWLSDNSAWVALVCGLIAIAYGLGLAAYILKQPAGNEKMREIAGAIQEGAKAYLNRQYAIIGVVAVVLFLVIGFLGSAVDSTLLGWKAAIGFLIGAVASLGSLSISHVGPSLREDMAWPFGPCSLPTCLALCIGPCPVR